MSADADNCFSVCTSRQITSSPFCSVARMATSTLAKDAGMREEVFTAVTILVVPAAIG
jgi:hypothetical protein